MKRLSAGLLALVACFVTQSDAFGQMQSANCDCHHGGCPSPACQGCNPCGSGLASFWTKPLFPNSCAAKCCATKAYPDAGWAAPARLPVNYDGAWYGNYVPQQAYGTPGGGFIANYPTVYQPTDTTQLGYYYNKVPTWQTRTDMIPPVPRPGDFHTRTCNGNGSGCFSHHSGYVVPVNSTCQDCNNGHYTAVAPPQTIPSQRYVVRPSGPQRKGLLGGFRLASMTEVFD